MKTKLITLVATLVAAVSVSAHAAGGAATKDQLKAVAGKTEAQVLETLGQPQMSLTWDDGSRSLVYGVSDAENGRDRAYAQIGEDGKIADVQYSDEPL